MPNSKGETVRTAIVTFLLLLAIAAMVWHLSGRLAHGTPSAEWGPISPEVRAWAKQQHNSRGEWCCDESDGHPYLGDYTLHPDGHVTAELDGKPHEVDASLVLRGPNPTGHAVWWFREIGGQHRDYCFAPGTLS